MTELEAIHWLQHCKGAKVWIEVGKVILWVPRVHLKPKYYDRFEGMNILDCVVQAAA